MALARSGAAEFRNNTGNTMAEEQNKVAEETRPEGAEEQAQGAENAAEEAQSPEQIQALLEDARAKADDHWNQLLRTRADMENLRRRAEKDVENAHKFGLEKIVQELLPVVDSMELGLAAINSDSDEVKKFREGSELTLKMLTNALEKFGVAEVNPVGEKFNPDYHQAMSMQESDDVEPNTVITVVQKGYTLHERLLRPAMVIVSKTSTPPAKNKVDEMA